MLFIPRIKLVEGVGHGLANFDEGRAEPHRAPISKGPNRNTAPVALSHLVWRTEFAIWHYRLLRQHDQGRVPASWLDHRGRLSRIASGLCLSARDGCLPLPPRTNCCAFQRLATRSSPLL